GGGGAPGPPPGRGSTPRRRPPPFAVVVGNAGVVFTADGPEGKASEDLLGALPGGAVAIRGGQVAWLGPERDLPADAVGPRTESVDAAGGLVAPGFVDSHTHLVWAGDRANEFALRCGGADYLAIAPEGGGIASTVRAVRAASEEQLVALALPRLHRLPDPGVPTAEP